MTTTTFTTGTTITSSWLNDVDATTYKGKLQSFTVAGLPSAVTYGAGATVYVSNAGGNGPCIAISNGSVWKRCDNTSTTVT